MISLEELEGRWYINQSNYPKWFKGRSYNPTMNYSIIENNGKVRLLSELIYARERRIRIITGFDTPESSSNDKFTWRGKGVFSFLKNKWSILYFDKNRQWAIMQSKKNTLKSKVYDVISRHRNLDEEMEKDVSKILREMKIPALRKINHR